MAKQIYGNRYQITEKIGVGGMAEVYKAIDTTLGRTVALKVMLPQYAADNTFAARFRQEAQAAANLQSPYIVNIYDWGRDAGSYYIVMEYVRGTDLKTAVGQRGKIHPRKVAEIGSQVCSALSVAHGYGIIHRDIKSANIMVQADGNVKVMDFGIAQAGNASMTKDSSVLGTAHYVSPEQAQGKELDPASDLYSLGIVMYEAATGKLPFDGPDVVSVAMKQVNEAPVPVRTVNPDVDVRLEAIIMRALEKDPTKRYRTANEMKTAIDNYLAGRGTNAAAPTQVIGMNGNNAVTTILPGTQTEIEQIDTDSKNDGKKGGKGKIIAIVLLLLVLAGAGIGFALTQGPLANTTVSVPDVKGMTLQQATDELKKYELDVGTVTYNTSDTVEKDLVMSQTPEMNAPNIEKGSKVNLVISEGKETVQTVAVPNLLGLTPSEAERQLQELGLVGESKSGKSDSYEAGLIFEQNPDALTQVPKGSTVSYTISAGEESKPVKVISVRGLSKDDATDTLEDLGLEVKVKEGKSASVGVGEVYDQSIAQGTEVTKGTTITIYVSTGTPKSKDNDSDTDTDAGTDTDTGSDTGADTSDGDEGYSSATAGGTDESDTGDDETSSNSSSSGGVRSSDYE